MCVSSHDNHLKEEGFRSGDCMLCILFGACYSMLFRDKIFNVQTHKPLILIQKSLDESILLCLKMGLYSICDTPRTLHCILCFVMCELEVQ